MTAEVIALLVASAAMVVGNIAYLVWWQRRAYIGERFIQAMGSYESAAAWLRQVEIDNERRLVRGLAAHDFTKGRK